MRDSEKSGHDEEESTRAVARVSCHRTFLPAFSRRRLVLADRA